MSSSSFSLLIFDRRFVLANIVALASLTLLSMFPRENLAESLGLALGASIVLPFLFVRLVLKESIFSYGYGYGHGGGLFRGGVIAFATGVFLAMVWGVLLLNREWLPILPDVVRMRYGAFVLFILTSALFNMCSCLFFQGFLLSIWRRRLGWRSIPIVTSVFLAFLFAKNGFSSDMSMAILTVWSFLASLVSFVSGSAWVAFGFLFLSDILFTALLVFWT